MASNVINFYNGKMVFLTGDTGFLGICLIGKLLRTCSDLKNIYLLLRLKKGEQTEKMLEQIKKNSVFNKLKDENQTDLFKKMVAVAGNVGQENLGLSPADRLMLVGEMQIVFHSAESLDFEVNLKSTNINLLDTHRVVELCKQIRDLKALIHVSSAYVNSVLNEVEECVYPALHNTVELLRLVEK